MDTRTEIYPHPQLSTSQSRMKIDSLLNPHSPDYSIGNAHSGSLSSSDTSPAPVPIDNIGTGFPSASGSQQQRQDCVSLSHHPASLGSSPNPYHFIEYSGNNGTDPRYVPRYNYMDEEMHFIWYHHVDRSQSWERVLQGFNRQFPNRQRHSAEVIQRKFYRFIKETGAKSAKGGPESFVKWTELSYPWMRENHKTAAALQKHQ